MRSCSFSAAGLCATARLGGLVVVGVAGAAVWKRATSPHPASKSDAPSMTGKAHCRQLTLVSRPLRRPTPSTTASTLVIPGSDTERMSKPPHYLILADKLNLSRSNHLNPRPGTRLHEAPDTNTFIFQRLRHK